MKLQEALDQIDLMKPNAVTTGMKIKWLSELDGQIWDEMIKTHAPSVIKISIIDEEEDKVKEWQKTKDIIGIKAPAREAYVQVIHGQDVIRVPMDGRRHTIPVPVAEALGELMCVKNAGFVATSGRLISLISDPEFEGYDETTDGDTVLLAPYPNDQVYVHYLASKIDIVNQETQKYQNDMILFNSSYETLADWWNRNYMPLQRHRQLRI